MMEALTDSTARKEKGLCAMGQFDFDVIDSDEELDPNDLQSRPRLTTPCCRSPTETDSQKCSPDAEIDDFLTRSPPTVIPRDE